MLPRRQLHASRMNCNQPTPQTPWTPYLQVNARSFMKTMHLGSVYETFCFLLKSKMYCYFIMNFAFDLPLSDTVFFVYHTHHYAHKHTHTERERRMYILSALSSLVRTVDSIPLVLLCVKNVSLQFSFISSSVYLYSTLR